MTGFQKMVRGTLDILALNNSKYRRKFFRLSSDAALFWFSLSFALLGGYFACINTFWFHDDWVFLGDAAGIQSRGGGIVRWVSYQLYWSLLWPIFKLNPIGWGLSRIFLHGAAAYFTARIGGIIGLSKAGQLFASLGFGCAPIAFESLYWGTGSVELLGGCFALASMLYILKGGSYRYAGFVLAILSLMSKESGLFLPLFFLIFLIREKEYSFKWLSFSVALLCFALVSVYSVRLDFSGVEAYTLNISKVPLNLFNLFFWLVAPVPWQTGMESLLWETHLVGFSVLAAWIAVGVVFYQKEQKWVIALLVLAIFSMGPPATLNSHILPRYDYLPSAFFSLAIGCVIDKRIEKWKVFKMSLLTLAFTTITFGSVQYRLENRFEGGRPVHRLVVKNEISKKFFEGLKKIDLDEVDRLVFFIEPSGRIPETKILIEAVGGKIGPELMLNQKVKVEWRWAFSLEDTGSFFVSVDGFNLQPLGIYRPEIP